MIPLTSILQNELIQLTLILILAGVITTWYVRSSLELLSIRPERSLWAKTVINASGYRDLIFQYGKTISDGFQESLKTRKSLLWVVPLVIFVGVWLPQLWQPLSTYKRAQVATIWQTEATIIGLSFVVIIFVLEFLQDQHYDVSVRNRFVAVSGVIPLLFLSISSLLIVGGFYLFGQGRVAMNGSAFLVVLNIVSIGVAYGRIAEIAFRNPLDSYLNEKTKSSIETIATSVRNYEQAKNILNSTNGLTTKQLSGPSTSFDINTPNQRNKAYIADIDYQKLSTLVDDKGQNEAIKIDLRQSISNAVKMKPSVEEDQAQREAIEDAILVSDHNRWQPRLAPFDRRLEQLQRFADVTIDSGNKSEFDKYIIAHKTVGRQAIRMTASLDEGIQQNVIERFSNNIQELFNSTNTAVDLHFAHQLLGLIETLLEEATEQNSPVFYRELLLLWFECYTIDRRDYVSRRLMNEPMRPLISYLEDMSDGHTESKDRLPNRTEEVFSAIRRVVPILVETFDIKTIDELLSIRRDWEDRFEPQIQQIADEELPPHLRYQDAAVYFTAKQIDSPIGEAFYELRYNTFLLGAVSLSYLQSTSSKPEQFESLIATIIEKVFNNPAETREILTDILDDENEWTEWNPSEWQRNPPVVNVETERLEMQFLTNNDSIGWLYEFYALTQLVHIESPKDVPGHEVTGKSLSSEQQTQLSGALERISSHTPLETQFPLMYENIHQREELVSEEVEENTPY